MEVLITLTSSGTEVGPFELYSDLDGYTVPFEVGVTKLQLEGGYTSVVVPDYTATIKVVSTGVCVNSEFVTVSTPTTTTTTTAP